MMLNTLPLKLVKLLTISIFFGTGLESGALLLLSGQHVREGQISVCVF